MAFPDAPLPLPAGLRWQPSGAGFAALGPAFASPVMPQPVAAPALVGASDSAAALLGIDPQWLRTPDAALALSGSALLQGSAPAATVYSGHQFGVWAGQLGDGRALLLGESDGGWEVQLKGAGRTPYSRGGDGRAVLRSSVREFLCSEAMHALGIPTTRALAVMSSPTAVAREETETAAVVTRLAPAFIRFGHFEHFSSRGQHDELRALADYTIARYYPECAAGGPAAARFAGNAYAALLEAVGGRTAAMVAQWQAVGFCHGVMNTDNMSILGLTIDYGPFQFLDSFDPAHVCNHSDTQGRYAYHRQPDIAYWNLFCLGQALMPLIADQELAMAALEPYRSRFPAEYLGRMRAKLGLAEAREEDTGLLDALLRLMARERTDWTIFWRRLSEQRAGRSAERVRELFADRAAFDAWALSFSERIARETAPADAGAMLAVNPKYVLRNHLGEQAIQRAKAGDFSEVASLSALIASPHDEHPGFDDHAGFPPEWASSIEISCSS